MLVATISVSVSFKEHALQMRGLDGYPVQRMLNTNHVMPQWHFLDKPGDASSPEESR